jgi:RNA polymerase sigma-70 factor, ECF subfamily
LPILATLQEASRQSGWMIVGQELELESRIVRLAMEGAGEARNRLFELIYARILRYHRKLAGGRDALADEWTQETLIRLIRSFDQLREPEGFVPWAFRIATNVWRDHFRAKEGPAPEAEELPAGEEHETEGEELALRVVDVLQKLPETYRVVLTLRYLEGMTYETMANVLGTPVPTLRSQIARGRRMIRRRLGIVTRGAEA